MVSQPIEIQMKSSVSTYSLLTASRLFKDYHLDLSETEVTIALTNVHCFYYRLLQLPLKNILNGIVIQQTYDYQVYAQKLMVDYLLSGETVKPEAFSGQEIRKAIEGKQEQLLKLNQDFAEQEIFHKNLIADSQKFLLHYTHDWQQRLKQALAELSQSMGKPEAEKLLKQLLLQPNITQGNYSVKNLWQSMDISLEPSVKKLTETLLERLVAENDSYRTTIEHYYQETHRCLIDICSYRSKFHQFIIETVELLKQLPDYQMDAVQLERNLESINFDNTLANIKE